MAASPTEIATVRADYAARASAWRSDTAAPPDLTPTAVVTLAQRALDDARTVTRFVAASYGGMTPPPPWPATDEMIAASRKVEAARDGAEVIVRRSPLARWKDPARVRAVLLRDGGELYSTSAALLGRFADAPRAPDVRALLPDPLDVLKGIPTVVIVLALWWAFERPRGRTVQA